MNKEAIPDTASRWKRLLQFIKFGLVGVSNTAISEGVYAVLIYLKMHYILASFWGFVLSVLNAYYWNSKYVFKEDKGKEQRVWWKSLAKTYMAYLGGFVLNAVLLFLWMDAIRLERWLGVPARWCCEMGFEGFDARFLAGILATGINLVITVPINYIVNKYWAFGQM